MSSFVQEGNDPTLFYSFAACEAEGVEAEVSFSTPEACPFKGPAAYEPPVRVIAYIRDKNEGDDSAFGCDYCHHLQNELGSLRNLVEPTLSAQGKPVLSSTFTSSSREKFERWYSDDVCSVVAPLVFDWNINSDLHVFDTNDFLPLGQHVEPRGLFTSEMSVFFQYNTGEIFNFLGDDDVWVFINSQLVIDLGGCHGAEYASVELDEVADEIGLTPGGTYELKVFHAERCYGASNFKAEMTLRQDQGVCPKECNAFRKYGYCDTESGRCVCIDGIGGADCGTCLGEDWCAEKGAKEGEVCPSVWLCDYTGVAREGGVVCVEEEEENLSGGGGGGGISEALTVVATLTAALLTF
ncbi:hypothetical protein TeGR_g1739 [Tetraparma gracilis]|jgi:fibro-slime domain-containing protein|uniref:PA14 domain-containing protein n=1 Tax=Tetraparma gracilis TaxID=2962635 RepID=A0ABQ6MUI0_9STRA|nr:hypothetical protein TeGR_g1739 [Tetraparma gracilis]